VSVQRSCARRRASQTRRGYRARRERKRFGQVIDAPSRDRNVARSAKFFERALPARIGLEERYGSATVRHLKRFPTLDETQHLHSPAGAAPEPRIVSHVLLVAQSSRMAHRHFRLWPRSRVRGPRGHAAFSGIPWPGPMMSCLAFAASKPSTVRGGDGTRSRKVPASGRGR